ncbi:MAG TPA: MerR family DNA-binding protein [Candidatus Limnocylindria bacterium]|nr:MerR family DNA-binding protein [Candidatus Limnocylindria bacterium]
MSASQPARPPAPRIGRLVTVTGRWPPTPRPRPGCRAVSACIELEFIARAKRLGLSLDQIRSLVDGWRQDDCRLTRDQLAASVRARLADVRHLVAELIVFRDQLDDVHRGLAGAAGPARCRPGCGCEIDVSRIDLDPSRILALLSVKRQTNGASQPTDN